MFRNHRLLATALALVTVIAVAGVAQAKGKAHQAHHHSGEQLLGNKIHANGNHVIDKVGKQTVSVSVKDGKLTSFRVKHSTKGEVAVKKYKSTKRMAQAGGVVMTFASFDPTLLAQEQDLGTTWIGYSFIDDYGDEEIYWFPYEMIYDGDTGAVDYIPLG
jgi:hypothetical protein